jgi:hypothetical protein
MRIAAYVFIALEQLMIVWLSVFSTWCGLDGTPFTTQDADHDGSIDVNCAIMPLVGYTCSGGF